MSATAVAAKPTLIVEHRTLIIVLFIAMFVADGANAVLINLETSVSRISITVRGVTEMYFLALLARRPRGDKIIFLLGLFFLWVFVLGSLVAAPAYEDYRFIDYLVMMNKLLLVFIVFETLHDCFTTPEQRRRLFKWASGPFRIQPTSR